MSLESAQPKPGTVLARVSELPEHGAIAVDIRLGLEQFSIIVVRMGDAVQGYQNFCPHAGYPLERPDGRVPMIENRYLICSAHGAVFDGQSGACVGGPGPGRGLKPVPLRIDGDQVVAA